MQLSDLIVRPILNSEIAEFKELMERHHYLGFVPKIGATMWYVATYHEQWIAILSFSVSSLKCQARDKWIGWSYRQQFSRLKLVVNNNRFLILPKFHHRNLASKVLSLCLKRLSSDWIQNFGYPVLIVETFVDPTRFLGTTYQASNWHCLGMTKGFRRRKSHYAQISGNQPKLVFVKELHKKARKILSQPNLKIDIGDSGARMTLSAEHMRALPDFFQGIPDCRRAQAKEHRLSTVLALSVAAILCGMQGYKAIAGYASRLSQTARSRFGCTYKNKSFVVPSVSTIRRVLINVKPELLDAALQEWNKRYALQDESLAIDGKTMRNALSQEGEQVQIMSIIGHDSGLCYSQKKIGTVPKNGNIEDQKNK